VSDGIPGLGWMVDNGKRHAALNDGRHHQPWMGGVREGGREGGREAL